MGTFLDPAPRKFPQYVGCRRQAFMLARLPTIAAGTGWHHDRVSASAMPLPRSFFEREVTVVARDLLGRVMVARSAAGTVAVRLTEVEAYAGVDDPASHAFRGRTPRTAVMFGPAGHLYTYFVYGMHWCANIVTGRDGDASAVLLRAGVVVDGIEVDAQGQAAAALLPGGSVVIAVVQEADISWHRITLPKAPAAKLRSRCPALDRRKVPDTLCSSVPATAATVTAPSGGNRLRCVQLPVSLMPSPVP
jgi:DNA-3-methyladenine glycosylase